MFDKGNIILGFTGSIGSGCTYISKHLEKISEKNYTYFKLSDIIRNELREEGNEDPTIEQLQLKGNELRVTHGQDILARTLLDTIRESGEQYKHIIIDGIKNDAEVLFLRNIRNFYLFSITADRQIRRERVVGLDKPFSNAEEFNTADSRDEKEADQNGQQVKKCNNLADIVVVNETYYARNEQHEKDDYVKGIQRKYLELIENNAAGKISPQSSPSVNELCMNIAYSMSKKSSCLKRKVGSVIIDTNDISTATNESSTAQTLPHIIASGYNEVPAGLTKCIFEKEYQKCYRDHLQEEQAKKFKCCPNCGENIDPKMSCPHCGKFYRKHIIFCDNCQKEIKKDYKCKQCNNEIYKEYLPGSKNAPGKLLDLCRALHAEEMAIMQLAKSGGRATGNLVLFATTQPCNLCANKIATAGIKKVVYAEPYDMEEATKVLKSGGVKLERFEGVKSSAFFKLYS